MPRGKLRHWFTLLVVAAFAVGCVPLNQFGHLSSDFSVQEAFSSSRILEDHAYYIMGSTVTPDAIIGIRQEFTLSDSSWQSVDITPEMLRKWVSRMEMGADPIKGLKAARIYNSRQEPVGVWYSQWPDATILINEDRQVIVNPDKKQGSASGGGGSGCGG